MIARPDPILLDGTTMVGLMMDPGARTSDRCMFPGSIGGPVFWLQVRRGEEMPRLRATSSHRIRWAALVLLAVLLTWTLALTAASGDWTLMYERDGFKAYERRGTPPSYRAEGSLNVDLAEVAAVLVDIPREKEWVSHLSESRLLEGDPLSHTIVYSRYHLPWPVKDRDAVIENVVEERPKQGEVRVRFHTVCAPAAPEHSECIRVPLCDGEFYLVDTGRGSIRVTYTVRLDPGGWLPAWLVRHFVRDAPAETLRGFKAQVLRTRGQYDAFIAAQRARWEREKAQK